MTGFDKPKVTFSDEIGSLERYPFFPSQWVIPRTVDVWLPGGTAGQDAAPRPVLYMHDGQNLFDPVLSYAGVDWGMDLAAARLVQQGEIPAAPIIVGIWNSEQRWREYMPEKAFDTPFGKANRQRLLEPAGAPPISDRYLKFMVTELKPFIDSVYRTLPGPAQTFVMGSSMGGLISLYAALEYPQVFGGAGCISSHWPAGESALIQYVQTALPAPGSLRFYFDYGTETIDASYEPYQRQVDAIFEAKGYPSGWDWLTMKFEGADHSETAWRKRVHLPLKFLLAGSSH